MSLQLAFAVFRCRAAEGADAPQIAIDFKAVHELANFIERSLRELPQPPSGSVKAGDACRGDEAGIPGGRALAHFVGVHDHNR